MKIYCSKVSDATLNSQDVSRFEVAEIFAVDPGIKIDAGRIIGENIRSTILEAARLLTVGASTAVVLIVRLTRIKNPRTRQISRPTWRLGVNHAGLTAQLDISTWLMWTRLPTSFQKQ